MYALYFDGKLIRKYSNRTKAFTECSKYQDQGLFVYVIIV